MFGRPGLCSALLLIACGNANSSPSSDTGGTSAAGGFASGGGSTLAGAPGSGGFTDSGGAIGNGGVGGTSESDRDLDAIPDALDADADGDGLLDADEATYGTDPTNPDTDGNGCYDYVDVLVGECDLDSNRVLDAHAPGCRPQFAQSRLVLHVRDDFEAPLDDVSIVMNIDPALAEKDSIVSVTPLDVAPTDAAVIAEGKISALRPGALLGVVLQVGPPIPNLVVYVEVVSASAGVLARGSGIVASVPCKDYVG